MTHRIMLIDDDSDDRKFFCDALAKVSPEITCLTLDDGHALASSLMGNEKCSVIFLDINMPGMSGWECLTLLKGNDIYRDIPVIMYSTSKHSEEIARAKDLGALCFFNKPPDFDILKKALTEVVEHLRTGTISLLPQHSRLFL